VRGLDTPGGRHAPRDDRGKWLDVGACLVGLTPQNRPEQGAVRSDQAVMCPVRLGQLEGQTRLANALPLPAKHGHIGAAESIDRLLGITDDEQAAAAAVKELHQIALAGVGILKLIDQYGLYLGAPFRQDRRMITEQRKRSRLQVVIIESCGLGFGVVIDLQRPVDQPRKGRQDLLRQRPIEGHIACDYQLLEPLIE